MGNKGKWYLSNPTFVTERVFQAQKAELVTGCYLKAVPCEIERQIHTIIMFLDKRTQGNSIKGPF